MYTKICVQCGKTYESESRNQRYCCKECLDKAQIVRISKKKKSVRRQKEYDENKEINRLVSRAYALAKEVAELCCVKPEVPEGTLLEVHHIDMNPFNNSPYNLVWLTREQHERVHQLCEAVGIVSVIQEVRKFPELLITGDALIQMLENKTIPPYKSLIELVS